MRRHISNGWGARLFSALFAHPSGLKALAAPGTPTENSHTQKNLRELAVIDKYHVTELARFLEKLKAAKEADGTLLDRTLVLYGSAMNNNTPGPPEFRSGRRGLSGEHDTHYLPLLLAGGAKMGIRQRQHFYRKDGLFSDLLLTMLHAVDIPEKSFAESSGVLTDLMA